MKKVYNDINETVEYYDYEGKLMYWHYYNYNLINGCVVFFDRFKHGTSS